MVRRQLPTALMLSALLVLAATGSALAKDDAIATLDTSLPSDPEPGSEITVGWTVESPGESGELEPFNAEGMFVRLIPTTGDPVEAVGHQDRLGLANRARTAAASDPISCSWSRKCREKPRS